MKLIVGLYWNQYATVKTRNGISRIICIRRGVRQGCVISPILFLLYIEFMMKDAVEARKGIIVNGQNINNLRFADDAVILACSSRSLQKIVDSLQMICKEYGMDFNVKKTKVMVFSKEENVQCNIKVNGEYLEKVTSYRYLGSIVTEDGRSEVEI